MFITLNKRSLAGSKSKKYYHNFTNLHTEYFYETTVTLFLAAELFLKSDITVFLNLKTTKWVSNNIWTV